MHELEGGDIVAGAGDGWGVGLDGVHQAGHRPDEGIGYPQSAEGNVDEWVAMAGSAERIGAAVRVIVHRTDGAADDTFGPQKTKRCCIGRRCVVMIDHHRCLEAVGVFEDGGRFGFGAFELLRVATMAAGEQGGVAEQMAQAIEVMNAVVHDIEVGRIAEPWPHVPGGIGTDPDLGIGRLADDTALDEVGAGSDTGTPAHLLIDGHPALGMFAGGHDGACVG